LKLEMIWLYILYLICFFR